MTLLDQEIQRIIAEEKKSAKKISDHQRMYDLASAFHLAASRCAEDRPLPNGKTTSPAVATTVNLAFACEIYLKSLINAEGGSSKKHSLSDLFKSLPEGTRDKIREKYKLKTKRDKSGFNSDIKELSSAFIEWRYIYENNSDIIIHIDRLGYMAESIRLTIVEDSRFATTHDELSNSLSSGSLSHWNKLVSIGNGVMLRAKNG